LELNKKRIDKEKSELDKACLFDFYVTAFGFLLFLFGDSNV